MIGPVASIALPAIVEQRAREVGDSPYVVTPDGRAWTYAQYHDDVLQWASRLERAGLSEGETVLVMTADSATASSVWMATGWIRAIEVPVNLDYRGAHLAHVVEDSVARLLIVDTEFVDRFESLPTRGRLERAIVLGDDAPSTLAIGPDSLTVLSTSELTQQSLRRSYSPPEPWSPAGIIYTSGTTGRSKGVLTTWAQRYETTTNTWPLDLLSRSDTYYNMFPQYHIAGKGPFLQQAILGGKLVLRGRFSTTSFWDDVDTHEVRVTQLVGAMASFLWHQEPRDDDADHSLQRVLVTPVPSYIEEFKRRFGLEVRSVFNMTEVSTPICGDGFTLPPTGSCGRARSGVSLRIVDDHDRDVPIGDVGELIVRNDNPWTLMQGYWRNPDATVEAWRNLWFHTGDAFRVDAAGNYYFVDRKKDALRRRGENISSFEVEEAVLATGLVTECAVVGVPSTHLEDEIMIFVVVDRRHDFRPQVLYEQLEQSLPRFMLPAYIEAVDELPRTPTQRVRKHLLRERGPGPETWSPSTGAVASNARVDGGC